MTLPEPSLAVSQWTQGAASQQGGRHEQQDRWGIFQPPKQDGLFAIVADGMGGHLDGALGAQIVIDNARQFIANTPSLLYSNPLAALVELCHEMHEAINRQSDTARSTVVMVWIDHHQAYWLNIGDSRLYHLRRGRRLMRTRDHSAVQLLMDLGEINESQMASHPAQNRLYRSLGGEDEPKPDTGHFTVRSGDLLALCSDGVWEYTSESELWDTTFTAGPSTAALSLVQQAIHRGGTKADNATLVLLRGNASITTTPDWLQRVSAGVATLFGRPYR